MLRRLVVLLVALVPSLGLLACGGDDSGGSASRATTAFCSKAKSVDRQFDDLDSAVGPSAIPKREAMAKAATSLEGLATGAPAAVRADLRTVADGVRKIADLLGQVDITDQAALSDPKNADTLQKMSAEMERLGKDVQAASGRVAKYLQDECGIDTGATTSSTTSSTTTTTPAAVSTTLG